MPGGEFSEEKILQFRKTVEGNLSLPEQTRQTLFELYDKALAVLAQTNEIRSRIDSYRKMQEKLSEQLEETRQALSQLGQQSSLPSAQSLTIADLEQNFAVARRMLEEVRKQDEQIQQEPLRRAQRRTQIPQEILAFQKQLEQVKQSRPPLLGPFKPEEPEQVSGLLGQIQIEHLRLQIELLEEEQKTYVLTDPLLVLQRDLSARRLAEAERQVRFWEQALYQARLRKTEEIQTQAEHVIQQAQDAHPLLQQLMRENAELARLQSERIRQVEENVRYALRIETQVKTVTKDFETIQTQIAQAGQVTSALGVLLLTKKNDLPDLREHQKQIRRRMTESSAVQLEWSRYDRQWSDLADVSAQAAFRLSSAGLLATDAEYPDLFQQAVELLSQQREILQTLSTYTMQYLSALAQLDIQERLLVSIVRNYQRFIEENIFWIKNTSWLSVKEARSVLRVVREWSSPVRWRQIWLAVGQDFSSNWGLHLLCIGGWIVLFRSRGWMSRTLQILARKVSDIDSDRFVYTIYSFLLSVLLACVGPLVLFYGGWRLRENSALFPEAASLSVALMTSSVYLFVYRFLWVFCSPAGLGEHFHLSTESLKAFRRHIGWFFRMLIPLVLIWCLTEDASIEEADRNHFLRFLFLGRQILLMVFLLILLRPSGAFLSGYLHRYRRLYPFRYVWYALCWLVPLFFCYLSISGYGFTAQQLHQRLLNTLLFVLALLFVYGLLLRWLSVLRNALHLRLPKELHPAPASEEIDSDPRDGRLEQSQERLVQLFRQTRKLINALTFLLAAVGIFWIWRDVLPAFGVLEKVPLWKSFDAEGQPVVITLAGLFRALVIGVLTVILTRNIPGFLEVSVLRRLAFDAGVRFAITTITRYVLVVVGVLLISSEVGLRWSSVQWLIAALGVGLGFGLQEVFANFVCGLLLLFERPLRVGDVVTIGDITGRVTRIQIRATTLQLWDRKELVVPNREFITGRLINWTLSDTILRLDFSVGVAYGSDIQKVERTLYKIAAAHPKVIHDDPAPKVVFSRFGDSALQFELRVYIPTMDCLVDVRHQIHCAIDEEFRKEGIEIAFPQQDLHIRSIQAPLAIHQEGPRTSS